MVAKTVFYLLVSSMCMPTHFLVLILALLGAFAVSYFLLKVARELAQPSECFL